jgi:hypothetical protein
MVCHGLLLVLIALAGSAPPVQTPNPFLGTLPRPLIDATSRCDLGTWPVDLQQMETNRRRALFRSVSIMRP